jgi:diguanylate cyclase (GGDEF)-like protein
MGTVELILSAAPSVPVVVLTTDEDDSVAELALGLGGEDFVLKTADGPTIARSLRKAIARRGHLVRNATLERVIGRRSTHDTLSGLPNRFLFTDRLRQALARNRQYVEPLGLLTLRVSALPWAAEVDVHGMQDAVIAEAARRLRAKTRRSDTLARIDEAMFAVILERAKSRTELAKHLDDLVRSLEMPMSWHGRHVGIRVHTGLAFCPDDGSEGDALVDASLRDGYGALAAESGGAAVARMPAQDSTSLFR